MLIAIDYDGTITAAPDLFAVFCSAARQLGHQLVILTMRYESEPIESRYEQMVDRVIYTGRKAKGPFAKELGLSVGVWVDDRPDFILFDAAS